MLSLEERILYDRYRRMSNPLRIENMSKYIRSKTKRVAERTMMNIAYPTYTKEKLIFKSRHYDVLDNIYNPKINILI